MKIAKQEYQLKPLWDVWITSIASSYYRQDAYICPPLEGTLVPFFKGQSLFMHILFFKHI